MTFSLHLNLRFNVKWCMKIEEHRLLINLIMMSLLRNSIGRNFKDFHFCMSWERKVLSDGSPLDPWRWTGPGGRWLSDPPSWCKWRLCTVWHRRSRRSPSAAYCCPGQLRLSANCPETVSADPKDRKGVWFAALCVSLCVFVCFLSSHLVGLTVLHCVFRDGVGNLGTEDEEDDLQRPHSCLPFGALRKAVHQVKQLLCCF